MKTLTMKLCLLAAPLLGWSQDLFDTKPSSTPEIFGSGIISTSANQRDFAISPDGSEIYYTVFRNGFDGNIWYIRKESNDEWSLPMLAPFSGKDEDLEPAFSPDGNRLYFASKRGGSDYDIWYVEREGDGWSDPIDVGAPINTSSNEFYPSVGRSGSLYYTGKYSHGVGGEDIWYAAYEDGAYQEPVPLRGLSESTDEFNAYVNPSENTIYYSSFGRADGFGGGDLYVSRKQSDGSWGKGENLGQNVNSTSLDYCPFVSPDSKYIFFTSDRSVPGSSRANVFDLEEVVNKLTAPSGSNIYWFKR